MNDKIAKKGIAIITANIGENPRPIIVFNNNHCIPQLNITKRIYAIGFPFLLNTPFLLAKYPK